ncbi:MAG: copper-translocating P-type ATPase [Phycisphaeraceae bacterium]|nr:MAG: copper-translocating P-type ATPase [Phycisphaeraceae bacterium]
MSHAANAHDHKHLHTADDGNIACCSHHEMKIDRWILVYLIGGIFAATSWIATLVAGPDQRQITIIPAVIGALMLGAPLFIAAISEIYNRRISSSSLAALAILASMAVEKYAIAAFLAFVLLVADQIVRRTAFGAQRAIEQLVKLTPDRARIVENGTERDVGIADLSVGQTVRVRPGENLPVDGSVVSGSSTINQASLTGEAMPVEVEAGASVYAGTTNLTGTIDLRVTQVGADTTIGKVSSLIQEAERAKDPRQLIIQEVARFYVPVVLAIAGLVFFLFSQSEDEITRSNAAITAVTVLVVTCPTALLLSSPMAMVASFASAARLGILIKRTEHLEAAAHIDTVVLDKTGTLTTGNFEVSRLAPADGIEGADLLAAAANGEQHSNHPLALSILRTATQARITPDGSNDFEEIHGRGVRARTSMGELCVGRATWLRELAPGESAKIDAVEARTEGMSGVHVLRDGTYLGAVGLEDKVRPNGRAVVERMRELGVRFVSIFTGDRFSVAKRVGQQTGVDAVEAECLPEEKHQLIKELNQQGYRVLMVGDGINDGPALAEAEVGVAMGLSGSDIAANSAGVALMTDELNRLPFLIELARRTRMIITQNIVVSILMAVVGLVLAATGTFVGVAGAGIGVGFAALFHFLPDVFVVGNSFRLFRFGEDFLEVEAQEKSAAEAGKRTHREASARGLAAAQPA